MIKRLLFSCLAGCCIGAGVGIILYANLGGDTVTVFQDGMHCVLFISYGQASRVYNAVLIVCAILFSRKYFGAGTLISAFVTGFFIDIVFELLTRLNLNLSIFALFILFFVGQIIYTLGLSILIRYRMGMNALDSLLYRMNDLTNIGYKRLRLAADLLLTLTGYLMGGIVGIGTLISIVSTGSMIEWFSKAKVAR